MSDTITLPRELVFRAVKALTPMAYDTWPRERQEIVTALRNYLAAEQPKQKFDHSIGAERFKVVRGTFWWHVKIGDSPTEHGKFRSSEAAQKMADDLLREFRNGAFVQNALAAEQQEQEPVATVGTQSNAAWKGYDGRWSPPGDPIKVVHLLRDLPLGTPLYTAPPVPAAEPPKQEPVAMSKDWLKMTLQVRRGDRVFKVERWLHLSGIKQSSLKLVGMEADRAWQELDAAMKEGT